VQKVSASVGVLSPRHPTGALALDLAGGLPSPRSPARAPLQKNPVGAHDSMQEWGGTRARV